MNKIEIQEKINNQDHNRIKDKNLQKDWIIEDKNYRIIGEYVKTKKGERKKQEEYMVLLYFIDNTEYIKAIKKYRIFTNPALSSFQSS